MHANQMATKSLIDPTNQLNCLNANIRKASRAILSMYMDEMRDSGLQGTQFTLLSTIGGFGSVTVNTLAQFMGMDQTTVSRNVNVLKKEGLVVAVRGDDRRTRFLQLTPLGGEAVERTKPMWLAAQTKLWNQLGAEKARQLLEITQEIVQLAEKK